jgi:hypothetical protein
MALSALVSVTLVGAYVCAGLLPQKYSVGGVQVVAGVPVDGTPGRDGHSLRGRLAGAARAAEVASYY